ncbi:hypothetical protein IKF57_00070 [Candidatus Saccharibacteria bacterium]|nr:hypothetical protein [Candidatus Saccharibacteria bacterium]
MKRRLSFYYIALLLFCQALAFCIPVMALDSSKTANIVNHCDTIRENLRSLQKSDSRTRVYLGSYYEAILTKFITPLNVRLVENNLSTANFVENQNKFAEAKTIFTNDFISYQQHLEELININCKTEPDRFYEKLEKVRAKRQTMEQDVLKLRTLISDHVKLVMELKGRL